MIPLDSLRKIEQFRFLRFLISWKIERVMVVGSLRKKLKETCKNTRKKMMNWCHFPVSGIVLLYILMFVNKLMDVSPPQRLERVC